MRIDYLSFLDKIWEAMPADEYVAMASDPHVLGDPLLKTQHFIGSSKWEKVSDTEAIGWHQLRVPHQKYTDASRTEIAVKGHAHGSNQHWYRKIDGTWKFAGLAPIIRWGEFDFDKVFASGRETFGDQEKALDEVAVVAGVKGDIPDVPAALLPVDEEAAHTASGVGSTLEKLPVEVTAHMMDSVPNEYTNSALDGLVAA
ncbi:scytalone dehydratase, partial [Lecanoromycetidae sp. Uapishka_2]